MKPGKIIPLFILCLLLPAGCEREIMVVETGSVSEVLSTTVHITGHLDCAGEGIKIYGHCVSVSPGPTISDIKTEFCSTIGTGEFTSVLYNLQPATTYHARGYIASGNVVVYGSEISFTTE